MYKTKGVGRIVASGVLLGITFISNIAFVFYLFVTLLCLQQGNHVYINDGLATPTQIREMHDFVKIVLITVLVITIILVCVQIGISLLGTKGFEKKIKKIVNILAVPGFLFLVVDIVLLIIGSML